MMTKIWIFIAIVNIHGTEAQVADGIKYAFERKELCEYAIANSTKLKCIELTLVP